MRDMQVEEIVRVVRQLCMDANFELREDTLEAHRRALAAEESPLGREVIRRLLENAEIARTQRVPFCQDTGYAVLFLELGQDLHLVGGTLEEAVNEGVRQGYRDGYLRKSLLVSPLDRVNTGDNTPALIQTRLVAGDGLKMSLLIKGAGCDNVSALRMFTPAQGLPAALDFIVETVDQAGPNASPPMVIGVGMGGPFAQAALLALRALLWPVGERNPNPRLAEIEEQLLARINDLGIGPAGYGGRITALGLHIEAAATHMASFPVAVNIDCHSHRVKELIL